MVVRLELDIGTVMFAGYDKDGHPVTQPDFFGEHESGIGPSETHHLFGFMGLPHEPELDPHGRPIPTKSGACLYGWAGDDIHVWPLENTFMVTRIPRMKKGGSVQYGGKRVRPAFSMIDGESGSYTLYVPYAFTGTGDDAKPTKACTIGVDVRTPGSESISIVHGDGMAITMFKGSVTVKNGAGDVYLEVSPEGVTINGNLKVNGGVQFGGAAGAVPVLLTGMVPSTMMKGA